ncbi:MAG: hypothetical protein ABIP39_11270 [Polyangiaceae bacterium]
MTRIPTLLLHSLFFALALALTPACEKYVAPPAATIDGIQDGVLADSNAPLVVRFSKSVDPSTLRVKVVTLELDADGHFSDERGDQSTDLKPLFSHDPDDGDKGGVAELLDDDTTLKITPKGRFPVGPKLAVLIEPGLSNRTGDMTAVRKRLLFSYAFTCSGKGTQLLTSGAFFFLLDINEPVGALLKQFVSIVVDPATGKLQAQFTGALRIRDPNRCPTPCTATEVCRLLPKPACVIPSTRPDSVDEFPDFFPSVDPPGYTLATLGCAEDDGDAVTLSTEPANLVTSEPQVTVKGLVVTVSMSRDPAGILRGTGTVSGGDVLLGTAPVGAAVGAVTVRSIPSNEAPMNIPQPPPASP